MNFWDWLRKEANLNDLNDPKVQHDFIMEAFDYMEGDEYL